MTRLKKPKDITAELVEQGTRICTACGHFFLGLGSLVGECPNCGCQGSLRWITATPITSPSSGLFPIWKGSYISKRD